MLTIDSDFPGGNIIVDKIDGDSVYVRQDLRDTDGWWFHWCFRITGAAGREITFLFTDKNVLTEMGPSISEDGVRWRWLGPEAVGDDSFTFRFPQQPETFFLTYSIPYVESHLNAFLEKHRGRPELQVSALTTSERGRTVEKLLLRNPGAASPRKILLTARHHACESVANYVMEGVLEFALDRDTGFLETAELLAVPFVDKDGVENGDQGKKRKPHDHNRDYVAAPVYASTRALMNELDAWADDRLDVALDLHCPWIRSDRNVHVFFAEPPESHLREFRRFSDLLARTQSGTIRYDPANNIACGESWNTGTNPTFGRYMRDNTPARVSATLEFPYALAGGEAVTADRARDFGRSLARAMLAYIESQSS